MSYLSSSQSLIDDLNKYLRKEVDDDVAISSLDTLLNLIAGENDEKKIEIFLAIVFNETNGLLQFLKEVKKWSNINRVIVERVFDILKNALSGFKNATSRYIPEIFDICKTNSSWAESPIVKHKSYEFLIFIIRSTSTNSFFQENAQILLNFLDEVISKTESTKGSTELRDVYLLIGSIIDSYREITTDKNKKRLLRKLKSELDLQLTKENTTVLEGCYECLLIFLKQFAEEQFLFGDESVYTLVKKGCELNKRRKTSIRAAFRVIGQCFPLFGEDIYNDYEFWFSELSDYLSSSNKDDYIVAFQVLDIFYSNMAKLLSEKEDAKSKDVLKFFLEKLTNDLSSLESRRITSAMKNFGHFATTCKKHGIDKVENMFHLMAEIADKYCSGAGEENMELFHLSDLLVSIVAIISCESPKIDNFDENKLNILARITIHVIVSYPKVVSTHRDNVRHSIIEAVVRLGLFNATIFDLYLEKFVYWSLIRSCSFLMESEVELAKSNHEFTEEIVSASDYNSVWRDLCNVTQVTLKPELDNKKPEIQRRGLHSKILDKFISSVLKIIEKLDFLLMEDDLQEPSNCVISIERGAKPRTENDYYIFANLVQLFSHVITTVDFDILKPWISKLTTTFINLSMKCPIKNGFFELLSVVLKKCKKENDWNEETRGLNSFILEILSQIPEFKGPDLISCLHIMMNVPPSSIKDILPYMITLFQNVFTLGLENISLAREGLNTLNEWYLILSPGHFDKILPTLMPYLHSYLDFKEFEGDTDAMTKYEETLLMPVITQRKNKLYRKFRKVYVDTTNTEHYKLRRDIIRFLGRVNTELCTSMYSAEDFAIREMTDVLKFDLPYVDMKVRIYLDRCLPRIMELARNSSDTRTRTVACELLHSITTVFIGNTAHDFQSIHPKGAETMSRNLLVCVFKLGSDMNGVISQLYRPLSFQLTRYYSSKIFENRNFVTHVFLEILFDGISNEDDTSYRQFSGELIQEFVDWSIKQSKHDQYDTQVNSNVVAILKRIYLFCMLPCSRKRLGAATAFNNIYRKLREELIIIQNYWIEILYYFVRSLNFSGDNDCNNKQTSLALDHVKRVLYERFDLFTEKNCSRRLPKELEGGTLTDVVNWLFTFCTSRNRYCRTKCVSYVEDLASRLEHGSFENYFNAVGRHRMKDMLKFISRDPEIESVLDSYHLDCGDLLKIVNWMEEFLSGLYCVNWLVVKKVSNVDHLILFEPNIIDTMKFFVKSILPLTKNNFLSVTTNTNGNFQKITSSFELFQQEIFLIVLNLLVNSSKENFASFASEDVLWDKFVLLLFEPSQFSVAVLADGNWDKIITLMFEYISLLPESSSDPIFTKINNFLRENTFWERLNHISEVSFSPSQDQQYLDGLNVLQATNVLFKIVKDIELQKKEIIKHIFASLRCNNTAVSFSSRLSSFLKNVAVFCLKNLEITFIIELIFNSVELRDEKKNLSIAHGRHFFCTLKEPLIEYLNGHQTYLISYCLEEPASITSMKIRTLVDCVVETYDSKKIKFDEVVCAVYTNWKTLMFWSQCNDVCLSLLFELIEKTIDYYRGLEKYDRSLVSVVFQWLLAQLTRVENSVMAKKLHLSLLPSFLAEKLTENEDQMLRTSLNSFQQQYFVSVGATASDDKWNVILFVALLHSLVRSRSMLVLEFVVRIRCLREGSMSCDDRIQESLEKLCESTSEELLTLLLFVYEICQQKDQSIEFRVNCIQIFLTPMLRASSEDSVIRFFHSKLANIWNTFKTSLRTTSTDEKINLSNWTIAVLLIDAYSEMIPDFDSPELTAVVFPNHESCIRKEVFKTLRDIVVLKMNLANCDVACVRKLQCYAFNALIKVMRRVHREEKFYKLVFMESPGRDMFIWSRIVDCNVRIELRMVPDQISTRKKQIKQQKRKIRSNRATNAHLSIPTQYLATSSLVDDVVRHDMSEWNIGSGSRRNGNVILDDYSIDLEEDKLNNHECMASLCELVNFIFKGGICTEPKVGEGIVPAIPEWMECLRESFKWYLRKPKQKNVVMFILKLISNSDQFFRPFAAYWVDLIVDSLCVMEELNYFVVEIIVMLLDWNTISTPKNRDSTNRLLNFVIRKMDENEYVTSIQNYLFDLIDAMIMTWHESLHAPTSSAIFSRGVLGSSEKKLELGLKICKQFLSNKIVPFDDKTRFIPSLLHQSLMKRRSNILLMFEVTALTLRVLKDKRDVLSVEEHSSLHKRLVDCLNNMNAENTKMKTDLFFSCLMRTVSYYPNVLQSFAPYLLSNFGKFQGEIKTKCLKILNADVTQLQNDAFTVLMRQNFVYCIRGSDDYELRKNALETIKLCLEKIQEQDLRQLMPDIWRFSTDVTSECRSYAYDIADYIYERNKNKTNSEQIEIEIKCKTILLNGLLDNDSTLQQKIFSSWVKRLNLENKVAVRFEQIMRGLYSPLTESQFVCNAVDFLLDASRLTPDYESKIFDNPLFGGCQFQKHEVNLSYRSVASHTPLFGSSFTNKFFTLSQNSDFGSSSAFLRGTQDNLMFQLTLDSQMETDGEVGASSWQSQSKTEYQPSAAASQMDSAIRKLKRPLYESSTQASLHHASINIRKRDKREDLLKQKASDRQKPVNLYRRYRYGDIPDIEIPRSALIEPLRVLAKRDPLIGKLVFTGILEGILKNVNRKSYLNSLNNNLKEMCKDSPLRDTIFVETLFEIAFSYPQDIRFDTQQVMTASYASGMHSFGALLLEEFISSSENVVEYDEQPSKKRKTDDSCQDDTWTQLAELYKALDQTDIVNGILKEKLTDTICFKLKQGLEFEQNGNGIDALKKYNEVIDETSSRLGGSYNERFVLEAYSNCAAYLSRWNELNNQITNKFVDVNALWNDNWNVETTLPWFLASEAYTCMYETRILGSHDRRNVSSTYTETIEAWLENEDRNLVLMNLVPESLVSLLILVEKPTEALVFINKCVKLILDDWRYWKSTEDKFFKVQTLSEFEALLMAPADEMEVTIAERINRIIEIWKRNTNSPSNSVWWDRKIVQKLFFKKKYTELVTANEENSFETLQRLDLFEVETILSFIENALDHENIAAVCKYLRLFEKIDNNEAKEREDVTARYNLDLSRMFLLQGIKSAPRDRKTDLKICLEQLLKNHDEIIKLYPYEYHTHVAYFSSVIIENEELVTSDKTYWIDLASFIRTVVLQRPHIAADDIVSELRNAILSNCEKAATGGLGQKCIEDVSKAYLKAAQFCRRFMDEDKENETYQTCLVRAIFNAMKYDSKEGQMLFPTLLQLSRITSDSLKHEFLSHSANIEEWKFLPWISQLFAYVDVENMLPVIEDIVIKMAKMYPTVVYYPYLLCKEKFRSDVRVESFAKKLENILETNPANGEISRLIKELSFVRTPASYFTHCWQELRNANEKLFEVAAKIDAEIMHVLPSKGKLFQNDILLNALKSCLDSVKNKRDVKEAIDSFGETVSRQRNIGRQPKKEWLKNFNPWLVESFTEQSPLGVEIPGQYDQYSGCTRPDAVQHVKIYEFEKNVEVQNSKQQPIKIELIGTDGNRYSYLIKFEEDMRQDQRIQRIFVILNRCSRGANSIRDKRKLSAATYNVFPLDEHFAMIEWVNNTTTLKDFMDFGCSDEEKQANEKNRLNLQNEYLETLRKRYCPAGIPSDFIRIYEEAMKRLDEITIVTSFRKLSGRIPEDVFRKSLVSLCHSSSEFWQLRNQFMSSYSTMCIYGWILGIGDRHLKNTLVCLKTGNCIGIDFGVAFGTGIENLRIPELIPFRMTPHIKSIMAPFFLTGLIRETMINILRVIRENEYVLLATLQIFILDPSSNWINTARNRMPQLRPDVANNEADTRFCPKQIDIVKRKLRGGHPTQILHEELNNNNFISDEHRSACHRLIERFRTGITAPAEPLTVVQQATCLLDLATDECILGTSWHGLETYI